MSVLYEHPRRKDASKSSVGCSVSTRAIHLIDFHEGRGESVVRTSDADFAVAGHGGAPVFRGAKSNLHELPLTRCKVTENTPSVVNVVADSPLGSVHQPSGRANGKLYETV
jgi:hypothetical protein